LALRRVIRGGGLGSFPQERLFKRQNYYRIHPYVSGENIFHTACCYKISPDSDRRNKWYPLLKLVVVKLKLVIERDILGKISTQAMRTVVRAFQLVFNVRYNCIMSVLFLPLPKNQLSCSGIRCKKFLYFTFITASVPVVADAMLQFFISCREIGQLPFRFRCVLVK
jgi:hypothetical protein